MVSILGFTGLPAGWWRVASCGYHTREPCGRVSARRGTPSRLSLAALASQLGVSWSADHRMHTAKARAISGRAEAPSMAGRTPCR